VHCLFTNIQNLTHFALLAECTSRGILCNFYFFILSFFHLFISSAKGSEIHFAQLEEGKQKSTEMRKHLMELSGSKNINHSSSGRLHVTIFLFDFTITLLHFVIDYLIPLILGHESSSL
jgi:hypothetical protein